jgi:hypothetical protein
MLPSTWHMYLIYMSLALLCWVLVYFWIPETRRLPLEEIGGLFGDTVVVHLTADGHHVMEKGYVGQGVPARMASPGEDKEAAVVQMEHAGV